MNAYWTLTASGGAASTGYSGTLGYTAGLNDNSTFATSYVLGKFNSGWTYPTVSATPSSTALSFSGANGFGNLAIGSCQTPTTANAGPDQTQCNNGSFTLAEIGRAHV